MAPDNAPAGGQQPTPQDPIAAATHANPYPYYQNLVARTPIYRDHKLGLWVAASAAAVTDVLNSALCRVRPEAEPVPKALIGSSAAAIFGRLIRMNDGAGHTPLNQAVGATLRSTAIGELREHGRKWARVLSQELRPAADLGRLAEFNFNMSVYTIAGLLGVPRDRLAQTAQWVSDFVRCVAPSSTAEQVERGKGAADHLLEMFRVLLDSGGGESRSLLAMLAREGRRVGRGDADLVVANGIGFLSQAYEATAGLIGNTLILLGRRPELRQRVARDPALLESVIDEVLRYDPPTHNTRRFLAEDGMVSGLAMKKGDAILVVVAAANYDPSANPEPEKFELSRQGRKVFTFGTAAHACPGAAVATAIARAGIEQLLDAGLPFDDLAEAFSYRPSANTRVPLFAAAGRGS